MRRNFWLLLLTLSLVIAAPASAAETSAEGQKQESAQSLHVNFTNAAARSATEKLQSTVRPALLKYYQALESARQGAVRKGDLEEVKRLDSALTKEDVSDFTSSSARSANQSLESTLRRAVKIYTTALQATMPTVLAADDTAQAEAIQAVITAFETALLESENIAKTVTVYANKNWQDSGITVKKGTVIGFKAKGKWSPGARKKIRKGKWKYIYGDPDTYNVEMRIIGKYKHTFGKTWELTAPAEGELSFRMSPVRWRGRLGEAQGVVKVKVKFDRSSARETTSLYSLVSQLIAQESSTTEKKEGDNPKPATTTSDAPPKSKREKVNTIRLRATGPWQDTLVSVSRGDFITVTATGKWSPGVIRKRNRAKPKDPKKKPRRLWGDADRYQIEAMVETIELGRGGKNSTFTAPREGVLYLRIVRPSNRKIRFAPRGSLTVTITVK